MEDDDDLVQVDDDLTDTKIKEDHSSTLSKIMEGVDATQLRTLDSIDLTKKRKESTESASSENDENKNDTDADIMDDKEKDISVVNQSNVDKIDIKVTSMSILDKFEDSKDVELSTTIDDSKIDDSKGEEDHLKVNEESMDLDCE